MSAPSDAIPAAAAGARDGQDPTLVRAARAVGERVLYIASAVAGVVLFGMLVSSLNLQHVKVTGDFKGPDALTALAIAIAFRLLAIFLNALLVGVFYCLSALHNERRDHQHLFWKSLPVSDVTRSLRQLIPCITLTQRSCWPALVMLPDRRQLTIDIQVKLALPARPDLAISSPGALVCAGVGLALLVSAGPSASVGDRLLLPFVENWLSTI